MVRPTTSIHAGIRMPPVVASAVSDRSTTARASAGALSAIVNATAASSKNGTRSQTVYRSTNGRRRVNDSVWPAANSEGKNHPVVITAGMAPITAFGAPRYTANAGRTVVAEANERPIMNSEKSAPSATTL